MSKELTAFRKHFEANTSIRVVRSLEERYCPHWKRLLLPSLNCDELAQVSDYIRRTFSSAGTYSHRLPKLGSYDGALCLTVDVGQIKEFIDY